MNLSLDYGPVLPKRKDVPIGCIGAGFIMRDCHLVAFRQAGFNPVAIAARREEQAREVALLQKIPRAYATVDEMLADKSLEVIDIAVPPDLQPAMIRRIVERAPNVRGILAQKPLAMSYREAKECVDLCTKAGVRIVVNQNMRYDQSVRAMKDLLNRGWLGDPVLATIDMRAIPHWMPWSQKLHSLATFVMSIHHLDTFRFWFGTPDRVLASTRPDPRTKFPHSDGVNLYILEYDKGVRACSWDDVWTGPAREGSSADIGIRWRVEGTEGIARGTIGWPKYPTHTPSTFDFTTTRHGEKWIEPRWKEAWFPEAFVGPMAELLRWLESGEEANLSGRDNLETIALCEAVFAAARDHRVTTVRERMA